MSLNLVVGGGIGSRGTVVQAYSEEKYFHRKLRLSGQIIGFQNHALRGQVHNFEVLEHVCFAEVKLFLAFRKCSPSLLKTIIV